ncbi:ATP-binding cassette domain-containing protein [Neobacillus mesonae]|nr:ATP-binding cassette domain-containing protein [Neobacillus mesonae]
MSFAIDAHNLKKSFNGTEVVSGIYLQVKKGELFALLGPNGAGKTTTIEILSTLLKPDGGSAVVAGYDAFNQAVEVRKRISVTGQFAAVDESLTGYQNLMLFSRLFGYSKKEACSIAEKLLHSFGLKEAGTRKVEHYSGGMRRRLDIAASIVGQPELIFLDEPTTGLDPKSRMQVWDIVRMLLKQGTSVLLTTQYLEEADQLADRIALIDKGRIVAEGTPNQLKASIGAKTLTLRLHTETEVQRISEMLEDYSLSVIQDEDLLVYRIPVQEASLANKVINTFLNHGISIDYFTLGEPSLDEVFLALTDSDKEGAVR